MTDTILSLNIETLYWEFSINFCTNTLFDYWKRKILKDFKQRTEERNLKKKIYSNFFFEWCENNVLKHFLCRQIFKFVFKFHRQKLMFYSITSKYSWLKKKSRDEIRECDRDNKWKRKNWIWHQWWHQMFAFRIIKFKLSIKKSFFLTKLTHICFLKNRKTWFFCQTT